MTKYVFINISIFIFFFNLKWYLFWKLNIKLKTMFLIPKIKMKKKKVRPIRKNMQWSYLLDPLFVLYFHKNIFCFYILCSNFNIFLKKNFSFYHLFWFITIICGLQSWATTATILRLLHVVPHGPLTRSPFCLLVGLIYGPSIIFHLQILLAFL